MAEQNQTPENADPMDQFERYDTVNTPAIVLAGFISAILTFAIIIAIQAMYFSATRSELVKKDQNVADRTANDVITQQRAKLTEYAPIDLKRGKVSVPIDVAMKQVVAQYSAEKPESND